MSSNKPSPKLPLLNPLLTPNNQKSNFSINKKVQIKLIERLNDD